ncbi:hypothetical protein ACFL58_00525 [Elusimicrobiota bacterium]
MSKIKRIFEKVSERYLKKLSIPEPFVEVFVNFKKGIAVTTALAFLFTSVFAQSIFAFTDTKDFSDKKVRETLNTFTIPYTIGRVTDGKYYGSKKIVINIQDLHCHAEVQGNINKIIGLLDDAYSISKVYIEGSSGDLDTSWVKAIKNEQLRNKIVETFVESGRLTGAEYYSIQKNKPKMLKGVENERIYKNNVVRLGKILDQREEIAAQIPAVKQELSRLKDKYYSRYNKRLEKLLTRYGNNEINTEKFYRLLEKLAKKSKVDFYEFDTIKKLISLMKEQKRLKYKIISKQLASYVKHLKDKMPYATYKLLLEKTSNFSKLDEVYTHLKKLSYAYKINLSTKYSELNKFFDFIDANQKINPIDLVSEERKLIQKIHQKTSQNIAEGEIAFISDFFAYLEEYLNNKISANDYEYFQRNSKDFKKLWAKYVYSEKITNLAPYYDLFDVFYKVNIERNKYFIENTLGNIPVLNSGISPVADINHIDETLKSLKNAKEIIVLVTGGFHTEGLERLLSRREVSYLVITPNVTKDTKFADTVYNKFAKQQAKRFASQTMALEAYSKSLATGTMDEIKLKVVRDFAQDQLKIAFKGKKPEKIAEDINSVFQNKENNLEGSFSYFPEKSSEKGNKYYFEYKYKDKTVSLLLSAEDEITIFDTKFHYFKYLLNSKEIVKKEDEKAVSWDLNKIMQSAQAKNLVDLINELVELEEESGQYLTEFNKSIKVVFIEMVKNKIRSQQTLEDIAEDFGFSRDDTIQFRKSLASTGLAFATRQEESLTLKSTYRKYKSLYNFFHRKKNHLPEDWTNREKYGDEYVKQMKNAEIWLAPIVEYAKIRRISNAWNEKKKELINEFFGGHEWNEDQEKRKYAKGGIKDISESMEKGSVIGTTLGIIIGLTIQITLWMIFSIEKMSALGVVTMLYIATPVIFIILASSLGAFIGHAVSHRKYDKEYGTKTKAEKEKLEREGKEVIEAPLTTDVTTFELLELYLKKEAKKVLKRELKDKELDLIYDIISINARMYPGYISKNDMLQILAEEIKMIINNFNNVFGKLPSEKELSLFFENIKLSPDIQETESEMNKIVEKILKVNEMYDKYFNREPDIEELMFIIGQINSKKNKDDIIAGIEKILESIKIIVKEYTHEKELTRNEIIYIYKEELKASKPNKEKIYLKMLLIQNIFRQNVKRLPNAREMKLISYKTESQEEIIERIEQISLVRKYVKDEINYLHLMELTEILVNNILDIKKGDRKRKITKILKNLKILKDVYREIFGLPVIIRDAESYRRQIGEEFSEQTVREYLLNVKSQKDEIKRVMEILAILYDEGITGVKKQEFIDAIAYQYGVNIANLFRESLIDGMEYMIESPVTNNIDFKVSDELKSKYGDKNKDNTEFILKRISEAIYLKQIDDMLEDKLEITSSLISQRDDHLTFKIRIKNEVDEKMIIFPISKSKKKYFEIEYQMLKKLGSLLGTLEVSAETEEICMRSGKLEAIIMEDKIDKEQYETLQMILEFHIERALQIAAGNNEISIFNIDEYKDNYEDVSKDAAETLKNIIIEAKEILGRNPSLKEILGISKIYLKKPHITSIGVSVKTYVGEITEKRAIRLAFAVGIVRAWLNDGVDTDELCKTLYLKLIENIKSEKEIFDDIENIAVEYFSSNPNVAFKNEFKKQYNLEQKSNEEIIIGILEDVFGSEYLPYKAELIKLRMAEIEFDKRAPLGRNIVEVWINGSQKGMFDVMSKLKYANWRKLESSLISILDINAVKEIKALEKYNSTFVVDESKYKNLLDRVTSYLSKFKLSYSSNIDSEKSKKIIGDLENLKHGIKNALLEYYKNFGINRGDNLNNDVSKCLRTVVLHGEDPEEVVKRLGLKVLSNMGLEGAQGQAQQVELTQPKTIEEAVKDFTSQNGSQKEIKAQNIAVKLGKRYENEITLEKLKNREIFKTIKNLVKDEFYKSDEMIRLIVLYAALYKAPRTEAFKLAFRSKKFVDGHKNFNVKQKGKLLEKTKEIQEKGYSLKVARGLAIIAAIAAFAVTFAVFVIPIAFIKLVMSMVTVTIAFFVPPLPYYKKIKGIHFEENLEFLKTGKGLLLMQEDGKESAELTLVEKLKKKFTTPKTIDLSTFDFDAMVKFANENKKSNMSSDVIFVCVIHASIEIYGRYQNSINVQLKEKISEKIIYTSSGEDLRKLFSELLNYNPDIKAMSDLELKIDSKIIREFVNKSIDDAIEKHEHKGLVMQIKDDILEQISYKQRILEQILEIIPDELKKGITAEKIQESVITDNIDNQYRLKNNLPPTIVFSGDLFKGSLKETPDYIAFTIDKEFVAVNTVFGEFGKGGLRYYPPSSEEFYDSKIKGEAVKQVFIEDIDLANAMDLKNIFADVFFTGGKTIILAKPTVKKEEALRTHKDGIIERWAASSIMAGMLCTHYIAGPDMNAGDNDMQRLVEIADAVQRALYEMDPEKYAHFREPLRATTSTPDGFSHMNWQVTSTTVLFALLTLLQDKKVCEKYDIKKDENGDISIIIQGFGDVGSGIVKILYDTIRSEKEIIKIDNIEYDVDIIEKNRISPNQTEINGRKYKTKKVNEDYILRPDYGIKVVGLTTSWMNDENNPEIGGIYNENGLDPDELIRLREKIEKYGTTSVNLHKDYNDKEDTGVTVRGSSRDVLTKPANFLIPAAGPSQFTSRELEPDPQAIIDNGYVLVEELDVDGVIEGANDSFKKGVAEIFHHVLHKLFLPGPMCNAGGVQTSQDEWTYIILIGLEEVIKNMLSLREITRSKITTLTIYNIRRILEELKKSEYKKTPSDILDEFVNSIRDQMKNIDEYDQIIIDRITNTIIDKFRNRKDIAKIIAEFTYARRKAMNNIEVSDEAIDDIIQNIKQGDHFKARSSAYELRLLDLNRLSAKKRYALVMRLIGIVRDIGLSYKIRGAVVDSLSSIAINTPDTIEGQRLSDAIKQSLNSLINNPKFLNLYPYIWSTNLRINHFKVKHDEKIEQGKLPNVESLGFLKKHGTSGWRKGLKASWEQDLAWEQDLTNLAIEMKLEKNFLKRSHKRAFIIEVQKKVEKYFYSLNKDRNIQKIKDEKEPGIFNTPVLATYNREFKNETMRYALRHGLLSKVPTVGYLRENIEKYREHYEAFDYSGDSASASRLTVENMKALEIVVEMAENDEIDNDTKVDIGFMNCSMKDEKRIVVYRFKGKHVIETQKYELNSAGDSVVQIGEILEVYTLDKFRNINDAEIKEKLVHLYNNGVLMYYLEKFVKLEGNENNIQILNNIKRVLEKFKWSKAKEGFEPGDVALAFHSQGYRIGKIFGDANLSLITDTRQKKDKLPFVNESSIKKAIEFFKEPNKSEQEEISNFFDNFEENYGYKWDEALGSTIVQQIAGAGEYVSIPYDHFVKIYLWAAYKIAPYKEDIRDKSFAKGHIHYTPDQIKEVDNDVEKSIAKIESIDDLVMDLIISFVDYSLIPEIQKEATKLAESISKNIKDGMESILHLKHNIETVPGEGLPWVQDEDSENLEQLKQGIFDKIMKAEESSLKPHKPYYDEDESKKQAKDLSEAIIKKDTDDIRFYVKKIVLRYAGADSEHFQSTYFDIVRYCKKLAWYLGELKEIEEYSPYFEVITVAMVQSYEMIIPIIEQSIITLNEEKNDNYWTKGNAKAITEGLGGVTEGVNNLLTDFNKKFVTSNMVKICKDLKGKADKLEKSTKEFLKHMDAVIELMELIKIVIVDEKNVPFDKLKLGEDLKGKYIMKVGLVEIIWGTDKDKVLGMLREFVTHDSRKYVKHELIYILIEYIGNTFKLDAAFFNHDDVKAFIPELVRKKIIKNIKEGEKWYKQTIHDPLIVEILEESYKIKGTANRHALNNLVEGIFLNDKDAIIYGIRELTADNIKKSESFEEKYGDAIQFCNDYIYFMGKLKGRVEFESHFKAITVAMAQAYRNIASIATEAIKKLEENEYEEQSVAANRNAILKVLEELDKNSKELLTGFSPEYINDEMVKIKKELENEVWQLMVSDIQIDNELKRYAEKLKFDPEEFIYLKGLYKQFIESVGKKEVAKIYLGDNFKSASQMSETERRKWFGPEYNDIKKDHKKNVKAAKTVNVIEKRMNGGIWTSALEKMEYLKRILNDLSDRGGRFTKDGKCFIGPKSTDLFFDVEGVIYIDSEGKEGLRTVKVNISEARILQLLESVERKEYASVSIQQLASQKTIDAINDLYDTIYLYDRMDDRIPSDKKRAYKEILEEYEMYREPLIQGTLPTIDPKTNRLSEKFLAPGGHGYWAFKEFLTILGVEKEEAENIIVVIANEDGLNNLYDQNLIGYMKRTDLPVMLLSTTRTALDNKGGLFGILERILAMLEAKEAELSGRDKLGMFYKMGLIPGFGELGKERFNLNTSLFNVEKLSPLLKELVDDIIGKERFYEIIKPPLLQNIKKGEVGNPNDPPRIQMEGLLASVILELNSYFLLLGDSPEDSRVKNLLRTKGILRKNDKGEEIVRFVEVINIDTEDRTDFFTPIKTPIDFCLQYNSDLFGVNAKTWKLKYQKKGALPAFQLHPFYNSLDQMEIAFGNTSTVGLKALTINGKVYFPDTILEGNVLMACFTDEPFDLTLQENREQLIEVFDLALQENMIEVGGGSGISEVDGKLKLKNIAITIDKDGRISVNGMGKLSEEKMLILPITKKISARIIRLFGGDPAKHQKVYKALAFILAPIIETVLLIFYYLPSVFSKSTEDHPTGLSKFAEDHDPATQEERGQLKKGVKAVVKTGLLFAFAAGIYFLSLFILNPSLALIASNWLSNALEILVLFVVGLVAGHAGVNIVIWRKQKHLIIKRDNDTIIQVDSPDDGAKFAVDKLARTIRENDIIGKETVVMLATGGTMEPFYNELVRRNKLSSKHKNYLNLSNLIIFNLDEYEGIEIFRNEIFENLIEETNVNPDNFYFWYGKNPIKEQIERMEKLISNYGGIDFAFVGIGANGHVGKNEPGTNPEVSGAVVISPQTRRDNARAFDNKEELVPEKWFGFGLEQIFAAKEIYLMVYGHSKAGAILKTLNGPVTDNVPATYFRNHPNMHYVLDKKASSYHLIFEQVVKMLEDQKKTNVGMLYGGSIRGIIVGYLESRCPINEIAPDLGKDFGIAVSKQYGKDDYLNSSEIEHARDLANLGGARVVVAMPLPEGINKRNFKEHSLINMCDTTEKLLGFRIVGKGRSNVYATEIKTNKGKVAVFFYNKAKVEHGFEIMHWITEMPVTLEVLHRSFKNFNLKVIETDRPISLEDFDISKNFENSIIVFNKIGDLKKDRVKTGYDMTLTEKTDIYDYFILLNNFANRKKEEFTASDPIISETININENIEELESSLSEESLDNMQKRSVDTIVLRSLPEQLSSEWLEKLSNAINLAHNKKLKVVIDYTVNKKFTQNNYMENFSADMKVILKKSNADGVRLDFSSLKLGLDNYPRLGMLAIKKFKSTIIKLRTIIIKTKPGAIVGSILPEILFPETMKPKIPIKITPESSKMTDGEKLVRKIYLEDLDRHYFEKYKNSYLEETDLEISKLFKNLNIKKVVRVLFGNNIPENTSNSWLEICLNDNKGLKVPLGGFGVDIKELETKLSKDLIKDVEILGLPAELAKEIFETYEARSLISNITQLFKNKIESRKNSPDYRFQKGRHRALNIKKRYIVPYTGSEKIATIVQVLSEYLSLDDENVESWYKKNEAVLKALLEKHDLKILNNSADVKKQSQIHEAAGYLLGSAERVLAEDLIKKENFTKKHAELYAMAHVKTLLQPHLIHADSMKSDFSGLNPETVHKASNYFDQYKKAMALANEAIRLHGESGKYTAEEVYDIADEAINLLADLLENTTPAGQAATTLQELLDVFGDRESGSLAEKIGKEAMISIEAVQSITTAA